MSEEKKEYDIFISHSHNDDELAHQITESLSRKGFKVFDPDTEIRLGDSISDILEEALENSKHFILLISPDYIASERTNFEMGVALGRKPVKLGGRIFPILTKEVDFRSMPSWLSNISAINAKDFSPEEIASKLKNTIEDSDAEKVSEGNLRSA